MSTLNHPYIIYYVVSGLLCFLLNRYILWNISRNPKRKAEWEDDIANYRWNFGIEECEIYNLLDLISLLAGFILFPLEIFCKLYKLITKKNFIIGEKVEK